ncbi:alpha-protein kinase 2 isoform X3 [Chanodichthys erythropterus]|uniref:alpha-protein kinase 2 isoform X3 n=1 Tax=Chanodichthys erythropterus TaxID=933992 RepID=UPI00351F72B2
MTAERVDNLLLLDTDAVNSSLASVHVKQDEPLDTQTDDSFSPIPDQQPDPASESQGRAMEIHSPNIHGETKNESGLVLTQPLDHTALIEPKINHPNDDKSNNCDFDTGVVMETDNITNSINNPDPIHLMDMDNMIDRNQNDKQSDLNTIEDPNEAHGTLMSPEVPSLTERNRQEEMSQYTILKQYSSFESVGLEVSRMANDDDPLVNIVSDVMNSEQNHEQPLSIANNETDSTSPESFVQTCGDTSEGVYVAVEAATAYKTDPEMPDIAGELMCAGFTTSQTPKIEDPKTDVPICLADLHEADILTHASTLLDSLGMSNVLETADMPANDSEIIQTVNKDLASSNSEFCTAVFTQTVQNLQQVSEHDVTDLESNRTDDSTLDRMIDTKFSLEVSRVQPLVACSHDTSATIGNSESFSPQSILETAQIGEKHEKDLSQVVPNPTPVTNGDLGKRSEETGGCCLKFTGTERDVKAGSELWLDACQFLAGEEYEGAIFDKWGRSCSPSPLTAHSDNTKASDYSRRENISIDHHAEDLELRFKPVERWSSSDSWASALSDWFQAVNTYPEDLGANTSSPDSKHSMAIQDKILEQRTGPDNANNTGQTCLSLNLLEPEEPGQASSRGQVESDNTNGTKGDKDGLPSHSDADRRDNTTMENNSEGNTLVEVTGDKISVLGLVFEEERQSSFSSPKISAYTSNKNLTGCVSGEERRHGSNVNHRTCPSQSDVHVSSEAGCAEGNGSFVHSNSDDCTVKPREEEISTIPGFIMPFAPLCTGNNFLNHSLLREDSPKADLDLPHKGIVNEIYLKSDQKSVSSDNSSEDRFHTCPDQSSSSSGGDSDDLSIKDTPRKSEYSDTCGISKELSKLILLTGEHFMVSEEKRVAYVTLDLEEPRNLSLFSLSNCEELPKTDTMPHKTSKTSSDGKTRSKHKEKLAEKQQHGIQTSKKQDLQFSSQVKDEFNSEGAGCEECPVTVIETIVITEKTVPKAQVKKKKKHVQHGMPKPENDPPTNIVSRSTQKSTIGKTENLEVKLASNGLDKPAYHLPTKMDITNKDSTQIVMSVRPKVEPSGAKMDPATVNATQKAVPIKLKADASNTAKMENKTCTSDSPSACLPNMPSDDIKRRRIADVSGAVPIRTRPQLPAIFRQARKDGEDVTRKAYSEVVKQKIPKPKEVVVPCVVSEIQADPIPADPQNILLWCQFSPIPPDATIKWTKEGRVLSEINKVEKDDGRFTLTILEACSKDLGLYKCSLNAANISVSTSEYHLTSEVLMELVIPSHDKPVEPRVMDGDEENIQCSPLLFKEDFLSDQYFGENQPASIVTEKVHFGEGMHRKAFRTTLREGNLPRFNPGHPCVLKVHNGINYGIKNNEELVQKNYSLAVEECHVQNTAREYIKAYNSVAKSAESFGEVPEIIPIYLVHRPSNEIPYATLEEELLGDFVKYSVKDGKEINLMHRDSEAGQKCCAFQHWVYTQTEGNLLVTDMQGVGMKLTDVGIATGKKGYKGFKGNCATSFIDQFKALHQCNRYCELLGLTSLQPKPKRTVALPKPKTQPLTKKKTFGPVLNGKS